MAKVGSTAHPPSLRRPSSYRSALGAAPSAETPRAPQAPPPEGVDEVTASHAISRAGWPAVPTVAPPEAPTPSSQPAMPPAAVDSLMAEAVAQGAASRHSPAPATPATPLVLDVPPNACGTCADGQRVPACVHYGADGVVSPSSGPVCRAWRCQWRLTPSPATGLCCSAHVPCMCARVVDITAPGGAPPPAPRPTRAAPSRPARDMAPPPPRAPSRTASPSPHVIPSRWHSVAR